MWNFVYTRCGFVYLFTLYTSGGALRDYSKTRDKSSDQKLRAEQQHWVKKDFRIWGLSSKIKPGDEAWTYHEAFARRRTTRGMEQLSETTAAFQLFLQMVSVNNHFRERQPWEHHSPIPRMLSWDVVLLLCPRQCAESCVCMLSCVVTTHVIAFVLHATAAGTGFPPFEKVAGHVCTSVSAHATCVFVFSIALAEVSRVSLPLPKEYVSNAFVCL